MVDARASIIALDPDKIVQTIDGLRRRIVERFPESGLSRIGHTLRDAATGAVERSRKIRAPRPLARIVSGLLLLGMVLMLVYAAVHTRALDGPMSAPELLQTVEATLSAIVLSAAAVVFAVTIEHRSRRKQVLLALHELRVLAHVIDMHQLAKDPERSFEPFRDTASSPKEKLSPFDLDRYLNYCGDLLALVGKVAAWYLQDFQDEIVLGAVNEIEDLTNGLSRKIWQKLMLLDQMRAASAG